MFPKQNKNENAKQYLARVINNKELKTVFPSYGIRMAAILNFVLNGKKKFKTNKAVPVGLKAKANGVVTEDTIEGVEYWVLPVIMLGECVANRVFYPGEELEKSAPAWNGRYIPVNHPLDAKGNPISVNSPRIIEKVVVGQVFNCVWDDESLQLKADAYIGKEKAKKVDPVLNHKITTNSPIDVSTGMWQDEAIVTGVFNDKEYDCIASNIKPDHLAALPLEDGAYSWADGGGMPRINQDVVLLKREELAKYAFSIQKLSHSDKYEVLRKALKDLFPDEYYVWVYDIYDDEVVFTLEANGSEHLFKMGYATTEQDAIELKEDVVEVQKKITYVPIGGQSSSFVSNKQMKGNAPMKKIDTLINNKRTKFTEKDREFLSTLSEDQLDLLVPVEETIKDDKSPVVNTDGIVEQILSKVNGAIDQRLADNARKVEINPIINRLVEHEDCDVPREDLEQMSIAALRNFERALYGKDMTGRFEGMPKTNKNTGVPPAPSIVLNKKDEKKETNEEDED